jgi:hypothetical protein
MLITVTEITECKPSKGFMRASLAIVAQAPLVAI